MKTTFFLILALFVSQSLFAGATSEQKNNAEYGALILAQQLYNDNKIHQAKVLVHFAHKINAPDEDNIKSHFRSHQKEKSFINDIKENRKPLLKKRLKDNGKQYINYMISIIDSLTNSNEDKRAKEIIAYVISTIDPKERHISKYLNRSAFQDFYKETFPDDEGEGRTDHNSQTKPRDQSVATTIKNISVDYSYNPAYLLKVINMLNKNLAPQKINIVINYNKYYSEKSKYPNQPVIKIEHKEEVDGITQYFGPKLQWVTNDYFRFKKATVKEILDYITFTTTLTYSIRERTREIIVHEGTVGKDRPKFTRSSLKLKQDLDKNSRLKAQYNNSKIQLKGTITSIQELAGNKLRLTLNKYYICDIVNDKLKSESVNLMKHHLTLYHRNRGKGQSNAVTDALKFLTVAVRGTISFKENSPHINSTAILAIDGAFFYSK